MLSLNGILLVGILVLGAGASAQPAEDFLIQYPNIYPDYGKSLVEQYFADERALRERAPIDVSALVEGRLPKDTPGLREIGQGVVVTEAMVRYNNGKYDPDNPLFNDAEYARKLGYPDILAYPTFGSNDHGFATFMPEGIRDTLMVSQINASITSHRSIHPGDTLYLVRNPSTSRPAVTVTDLTPEEGSIYRHLVLRSEGSIYNQRGEKVNDVIYRIMTSLKTYRDDKRPVKSEESGFTPLITAEMLEAPDWMSRPAHVYTDADWETIKGLWRAEKRRGAEPLYWEDVKIGDQPTWTVDGPIEETVVPTDPYGMGVGGNRTLKREILDPETFRTMVRGENGIWRLPNKADYFPAVPDGAAPPPSTASYWNNEEIADPRRILVNFVGRDVAIRHINNWIGDHGWLYNIRWGIMQAFAMAEYGKPVPENHDGERFLDKVPFMQGKDVNAHPLTGDLFIVKSYVYDKYFGDGIGYADLTWWIETIDGYIVESGGATVRLPSRSNNLKVPGTTIVRRP